MKIKLKQVEGGWLHRNEIKTDDQIDQFFKEKRAQGFSLKVEIVCQGGSL